MNFRRFHKGYRSALLVVGMLSPTAPAWAQSATATADDLDQIEHSLQSSTEKQASIAAEIEAAVKAQSEISTKLITLAGEHQSQTQAIAKADLKLKDLSSQAIVIRSDLAVKQDRLSELLAGLQNLEQNPPPALVVAPQDVLQALRGAMMFGAVVPEVRAQADRLKEQLDHLEAIQLDVASTKKELNAAILTASATQKELELLQLEKKNFAITAAQDLAAEKQRAIELASKAKNLKQLLASLEVAKLEAERQKSAEAKAREIAEKLKQQALNAPTMVLSDQRGKLKYPLQGDILKQFGDDNGLGSLLEGLAVASVSGQNVISPVDGRVEFAGPFRSYGQLLILNAGEGYLILLAGMNQISAEIGQSIKAGEPVGTMGDGPSSVALLGGDTELTRPVLYIEFRKNNEPVDPSPFWLGGRKEALK